MISELLMGLTTSICGFIAWYLKRLLEEKNLESISMLTLLRDLYERVYYDVEIDNEEKLMKLTEIYEIYTKWGGNGRLQVKHKKYLNKYEEN